MGNYGKQNVQTWLAMHMQRHTQLPSVASTAVVGDFNEEIREG